jgi:phosphoribosylglycinamide formyltransferase-1
MTAQTQVKKRTAILISGRGSNMMSLVDAAAAPDYPAEAAVVISNRADAAGIAWAAERGIPTRVIPHKGFPDRDAFERHIDGVLAGLGIDIVCLAGFMRLMTAPFVERHMGRMINIHPSLLPSFRGLHTHEQALAGGVTISGCTVHFVAAEMDAGPIIAQAAVPVLANDTPDTLAARVLAAEHALYPHALALVASGRVRLENGRVARDLPVNHPAQLFSPPLGPKV